MERPRSTQRFDKLWAENNKTGDQNEWKNTLVTNLGGYKNPAIIKGAECKSAQNKDVYVYIDFMRAGRKFYTVQKDEEFYLHRGIIKAREEQVVPFNKR